MNDKREKERKEINVKTEVHSSRTLTCSNTVNVSKGGLFISTPEPLDADSELTLLLQLPGGDEMKIRGRVRWVRQNEKENERAGMGIEFIEINENTKEKLKTILEEPK